MPEPTSGLVVVDKPAGITSHDVVARVRRLAGTRKVGHAGTLDPMATGVLVLGVNRATRLLGHLTLTDKRYAATVRLGVSTTTDDAEGDVVDTHSTDSLTEAAVRDALAAFVGEIDQVPSAVSAIKVDGKRAYARVRDGEEVDLPARRVTVHSIEVVSTSLDRRGESLDQRGESLDRRDGVATVDLEVHCSSGTYIRAIARDLGAGLGVGGHLTALRRTAVGPFGIDEARTLDALADDFVLTPIAEAARAAFPALDLDDGQAADVRVGRRLDLPMAALTAVFAPDGEFLALYRAGEDGGARPVAVFCG
jgi:tRNA pseudouridine55 synthase